MNTYRLDEPRLTVYPPQATNGQGVPICREVGQAEAFGEALFFCSIGYMVNVAKWNENSRRFETHCNYFPEDLL